MKRRTVGRLFTPLLALNPSLRHSYICMRGARYCYHRVLVRDLSPITLHHVHCVLDLLVMVS